MKRIFLVSAVMLTLVSGTASCGSKAKKEKKALETELRKVKKENEAYRSKTNEMTSSIEFYKKLLNEINENLAAIDDNTSLAKDLNSELETDVDAGNKILQRVKNIRVLMENSKLKILALDRTLNDLRKKYGEQSEEVLELNNQLKAAALELIEREAEFDRMKAGFEGEIEGLEEAYDTQLKIAEDLKEMINRAWYVAGTSKELNSKGVIDKEGGFIGLGRVKVLNANAPEPMFNKLSKEDTDSLVFQTKKIKLITDHMSESYDIKEGKTESVLYIRDKKLFWKQSNYLVIQTN